MSRNMRRKNGFLCYAHANGESASRKYLNELQKHVAEAFPDREHTPWCDQDISSGNDWPDEIRKALEQAAYAVLFVNIEFRASCFVQQVEIPQLLEASKRDGLLLLPLWVSPCHCPDWLSRLQFLNSEEKPLASMRGRDHRDRIYKSVVDRITEHLAGGPGQSQAVRLMGDTGLRPPVDPTRVQGGFFSEDPGSTFHLELAEGLSRRVANELEQLRERFRCGERSAARATVDALLKDPCWPALDARLRGRVLRTAALYRLVDGTDLDAARSLAEQAHRDDPEGDGQVLAAHLASRAEGPEAALSLLEQPGSAEARHLKAAILVEQDQADEALVVLDGIDPATEAMAETSRLRALALLSLHRLPEAIEAAERCSTLAPEWHAVRLLSAVVAFWRACTPAALTLTAWPLSPLPFSRALIRADQDAWDTLAEAERTFASVAECQPEGSDEWRQWLTWRLICLLASGDRAAEAPTLANRLLGFEGPAAVWPLMWATYYGLDVERTLLKQRLHALPTDNAAFVMHRGLYYDLCLADGEITSMLDELDTLAPVLEAQGQRDILNQWRVWALTADDHLDEAKKAAAEITETGVRLRLNLQIARREKSTAPDRYLYAADALFAAEPGPDSLAEACEAHAAAGDWPFILSHADALIEAIPTPASLRTVVVAAWNQGDYRRCLNALDEQRHLYSEGRLPLDLTALRARCQRALGDVTEAIRTAREIYESDPRPQHLLELLDAQLHGGDREGMAESLRRMLGVEHMPGDALLNAARLAGLSDRELGVLLWRKATETGSGAPEFAAQALTTGMMLGIGDKETAPWLIRMAELAESGQGGVMTVHISEMAELIRSQREASDRVEALYRKGEVALHLLPAGLAPSISTLFHAIPEANRCDPDPLMQAPVLIRHGARPMQRLKPGPRLQARLILDTTALLTASDLGILEAAEKHFSPLYLTPQWHPILLDEIRRLRPAQPERLAAERRVADLVRAGVIGFVDLAVREDPPSDLVELVGEHRARQLAYARDQDGCWVDYLPLHGPSLIDVHSVELPSNWKARLAGPMALLDVGLSENLIDPAAYQRGSEHFPAQPRTPFELPGRGGTVLICPGILASLAEADLLPALAHRFRFEIAAHLWHHTERELRQQEQQECLSKWVTRLIDRVETGMKTGIYRPAETRRPPTEGSERPLLGLDDLLHFPAEAGDLIWIDDRYLNGHPAIGAGQTIGVVELLDRLRAGGGITEAEQYHCLFRLRASNYRYVPLDEGEILYWIGQAHSDGGRLIVPQQLDTLARYWAACLYRPDGLQLTASDHNPHGEWVFIAASRIAVDRAILATWSDRHLNDRRKRQRADWLLDRLYVGLDDIQHLIPDTDPDRDSGPPASEIGLLVMGAYAITPGWLSKTETRTSPAELYLKWIGELVLSPRLVADPKLASPAAALLGTSIRRLLEKDSDPALASLLGTWTLRILHVLPVALRTELQKDHDLMQRLGLIKQGIAEIGGVRFPARDFWSAVGSALRDKCPIVTDIDHGKPLTLRLVSRPDDIQPVFELADSKGKTIGQYAIDRSQILSPSRQERLDALRQNPHWWDGQAGGCEAVERLLAGIDMPDLRIRRLERLVSSSSDSHYLELEVQWRQGQKIRIDRWFPPRLDAVLTYVRCTNSRRSTIIDPEACWESLASSIPDGRGLEERLRRIALFPSQIPEEARQLIRRADTESIDALLKQLSGMLLDPVGRLHLLDLALVAAEVHPNALATAQAQIEHLSTSRLDAELRLVLALVDIAYKAFEVDETDRNRPPQARLLAAWVHAARVTGILLAGGADPSRLTDQMKHWAPFQHQDLYAAVGQPFQDLAWPWNIQTPDIRFVAVGAILGRHAATAGRLDLESIQSRLGRLLSGQPDAAPDLHLLQDPDLLSDLLGCIWGGDRSLHLAVLAGPEGASHFSPAVFTIDLEQLITDLTNAPEDIGRWMMLWKRVGPGRLPIEPTKRLNLILGRLDLETMIQNHPLVMTPLMELAIRHISDPARIEGLLNHWAEGIDSGAYPAPEVADVLDRNPREIFIERLLSWAHGLASRHPDDPDTEFARMLEGLAMRSRNLASAWREPLTNIARRLPFARHRALRRTLLCVRARPEPIAESTSPSAVARKRSNDHGRRIKVARRRR